MAEKMKVHHESYMMGHKHGKAGKEPNPRGDGMKMAEGSKRDAGTEKGRPTKAADPGKARGDGMKIAAKGEGRTSKLSPMGEARKAVR